jgi:hypothetical protein
MTDSNPPQIIEKPEIIRKRSRHYLLIDNRVPLSSRNYKAGGTALLLLSVCMVVFLDIDFNVDSIVLFSVMLIFLIGVVILKNSDHQKERSVLAEINIRDKAITVFRKGGNGSGNFQHRIPFSEIKEVLFSMRDVPIQSRMPRTVAVDGFALLIREQDNELTPVIDMSLDHARTFRAARFIANSCNVGVKQVGKGWKS